MKLGISTLYLVNRPFQELVDILEKTDVKYWELVDDGDLRLNEERVKILNEIRSSFDLQYAVHAPFADVNIASLNPVTLKAVMKQMRSSLEYAGELDSSIWIVHPGGHSGLSYYYPGKDRRISIDSIKHLAKIADNVGVTVAVENMPAGFQALFVKVEEFDYLPEINNVKIAFDTGHAHLVGQVLEFIEQLSSRIVHIHVHDNDGTFDRHRSIGKGTIDWTSFRDVLSKSEFNEAIVIETLEDPIADLQLLSKLLSCTT